MPKIINNIKKIISLNLGIDLGTANTLIAIQNKKIISEPSVVAIDTVTNKVLRNGNSIGDEAKKMMGKTPPNIKTIRPLQNGVIEDFAIAEAMLRYFIKKARNYTWGVRVHVVIAIPSSITSVQRQAVIDSVAKAGAHEVDLVSESMAAAIGAGVPIFEAKGSMVVDIGGGTSEVAIISLGAPVVIKSINIAGDTMDRKIVDYLQEKRKIKIGLLTAEMIKKKIGSASPLNQELEMDIKGQHVNSSLPIKITIRSDEIREALSDSVQNISSMVKDSLDIALPEIAGDLFEKGIILTGGGALLKGLDVLIKEQTKLNVYVAESTLECVVRGTGIILNQYDLYKNILYSPNQS